MVLLLQRWEGVTVFTKDTAPIPGGHFEFAQKYFLYRQHTLILAMGAGRKRRAYNHTRWVRGGGFLPSSLLLKSVPCISWHFQYLQFPSFLAIYRMDGSCN